MADSEKSYIGDGIYAEFLGATAELVLTTEDGVSTANTIYFDVDVLMALLRFIERHYGVRVQKSLPPSGGPGEQLYENPEEGDES